jgi:hypothetical protein
VDGFLRLNSENSSATGSNAVVAVGTKVIRRLTSASLVSVSNIQADFSGAEFLILTNVTGATITIVNNSSGTAAERIITGTGSNITLANDASIIVIYDGTTSRWRIIGGSGGGAGKYSSYNFTGTTITLTSEGFQRHRYTGSSAQSFASTLTPTGLTDGECIMFVGTSNTNTIALSGSTSVNGFRLNGSWLGVDGAVLVVQYDATSQCYWEVSRNA